MTLAEQILKALQGCSGQAPMRVDALAKKVGVRQAEIDAELIDLTERAAITGANITRDGETFAVVWPTGMTPKALRCIRISPRATDTGPVPPTPLRQLDVAKAAQATHQPAAKAEEKQEAIMPRVTSPAKPRPERSSVKNAILKVIEKAEKLLTVEEVTERIAPLSSVDSVAVALRALRHTHAIGDIRQRLGKRNRVLFVKNEASNPDESPSKVAEVEAVADAIWNTCNKAMLGEAIQEAYAEVEASKAEATFSVDDAGNLTIFVDDEILQLDKPDARRLAIFLGATVGVFA